MSFCRCKVGEGIGVSTVNCITLSSVMTKMGKEHRWSQVFQMCSTLCLLCWKVLHCSTKFAWCNFWILCWGLYVWLWLYGPWLVELILSIKAVQDHFFRLEIYLRLSLLSWEKQWLRYILPLIHIAFVIAHHQLSFLSWSWLWSHRNGIRSVPEQIFFL